VIPWSESAATLEPSHIGSVDLVREGPQFLLVLELEPRIPRQELLDDAAVLLGFEAARAV